MADHVEYGYPSPMAAICSVCNGLSWLCPHPWELRKPGAKWEAFGGDIPWDPPAKSAAPEIAQASTALDDSEKFPAAPTVPVVTPPPVHMRARLDDAPPSPPRRHYLCGCTILFNDPWIWKIHGFPASHEQRCLYAENERFVAALRKSKQVIEPPQAVIERPAPKTPQKRIIESLALELPK